MKTYAVIDTNVIVSALLSKNPDSATVKTVESIFSEKVVPLYHKEIMAEYSDVLSRKKFNFAPETVDAFLKAITQFGVEVFPKPSGEILIDMDDLIFYEVALEKKNDNSYLVTGNQKHYPVKDFIVTPSEFLEIINN